MGAKLSNGLPKESEDNGLIDIGRELLKDPLTRIPVLAVVDCSRITTDTTTGGRDATVRILRMEQVHPDDRLELERLIRRAVERRKGAAMLPIDTERDLEAWFGTGVTVDDQGEVHVPGATADEPPAEGTLFADDAAPDPRVVDADEPLPAPEPEPAARPSLQALTWAAEVVIDHQKATVPQLVEAMGVTHDEAEGLLLTLGLAGVVLVSSTGNGSELHYDVLHAPSQIGVVRKALADDAADPDSDIYEHLSRPQADDGAEGGA